MKEIKDVFERSITKEYRPKIWSKFVSALKQYKLLKPNDHVLVCVSGGKDSTLMARLFIQLKKHSDFDFRTTFVVLNPGYKKEDLDKIKSNLDILSIEALFVDIDPKEIIDSKDKSSCFLSTKFNKGTLYKVAKENDCNKIAFGHHYDDVIETTMMNMLSLGSFQSIPPRYKPEDFDGIAIIRPMYLIREKDIESWMKYHDLHLIDHAYKFRDDSNEIALQREATKKLIHDLKTNYNIQVEKNIFKSTANVTIDMILGYSKNGKNYYYLDDYDE